MALPLWLCTVLLLLATGHLIVQGCMQVDAFTSEAFRGNPAAVCLLSSPLDDAHLQRIAVELNQNVTAFVEPVSATDGGFETHSHFKLRWFSPSTEVPLCGHGTLAAAVVLWSGECTCTCSSDLDRPAAALTYISVQASWSVSSSVGLLSPPLNTTCMLRASDGFNRTSAPCC